MTRAQCLPARCRARRGLATLVAIVLAVAAAMVGDSAVETPTAFASGSHDVFVNEVHYDNVGEDVGEGIEVAGAAGVDLSQYSLELYNGFDQQRYATVALAGELPDQENGYGTKFFPIPGLQNGAPDGIALVGPEGVVETVGYEGTFTALDGSAAGLVFEDIKQFEAPSTSVGRSLQLQGVGSSRADFSWSEPIEATPDEVNRGQSFPEVTAAPLNTDAPSISGSGFVGETQHCSPGSWEGNPDSYSYEWELSGSPSGVNSDSYTIEGASSGSTLSCTVTASNSAGSASAESSLLEITAAPTNTEAPTISGAGNVGETQYCSPGSWEGNPSSYSYEWTAHGFPVGYSESYVAESWQSGNSLTCTVTAYNEAGSASAQSAPVEVPAPPQQAPLSSQAPSISGTPTVTETLSCAPGSWENDPASYAYEWTRDGAPISEASTETYVVQEADQGHSLGCTVTASNNAGSASAQSALVEVPAPQQPAPGSSETNGGGQSLPSSPPAPKPTVSTAQAGISASPPAPAPTISTPEAGASKATASDSLFALLNTKWTPANVRWMLARGARSLRFSAPGPGTLSVRWTVAGVRASATGAGTALAAGSNSFNGVVRGRLKLRLTAAGRTRLRRHSVLLVRQVATFTPSFGRAQTMQLTILLERR